MGTGDIQAIATAGGRPDHRRCWWESPIVIAAAILLSAVPLLYPQIPPLVDLLGHMGRYRVQVDVDQSPWLGAFYDFDWALIGNLGVDLLIIPLEPLIGLEPAVKLIVLTIPPMTVAGFLWVAREVHGRIPPTVYFALPFALSHPFLYGFANYALSIAFAFLAFGLWLRLGRLDRIRLRSWLFVPISIIVFFAHTYGWGVLGLLCFSAEAVRQHDKGIGWARAGWNAAWHASVMALPILIMLGWRSETHGGGTADWFNWKSKFQWLLMSFRDRWKSWDIFSLIITLLVIVEARREKPLAFSRNLAFSALVLLAGFIILPRIIFGSAYADMRLIPYVIAVGLLAIRFRDGMGLKRAHVFAVLGLLFYLLRVGSTTASLAIAADDQQSKLEALDQVPMGSRVAALVGEGCGYGWSLPRDGHLGAMVIVRRQGFSNNQWVLEGQNLLELKYDRAGKFASDPSQRVRVKGCEAGPLRSVDWALAAIPQDAFDFLWLIDPPRYDEALVDRFEPVASGQGWSLFRLNPGGAGPRPATPRTAAEPGRPATIPAKRST